MGKINLEDIEFLKNSSNTKQQTRNVNVRMPVWIYELFLADKKNKSRFIMQCVVFSDIADIFKKLFFKLGKSFPAISKLLIDELEKEEKEDLINYIKFSGRIEIK